VRARLSEAGIDTMVYYPVPVHRLPFYADLGYRLPVAEAAAEKILSLPIWPQITRAVQERVAETLCEALA
jgi:dTDP-4-amino-4,6-dideoxygalactose transaminase